MTARPAHGPWPELSVADGSGRDSFDRAAVRPGSEVILWFGRNLPYRLAHPGGMLPGSRRAWQCPTRTTRTIMR